MQTRVSVAHVSRLAAYFQHFPDGRTGVKDVRSQDIFSYFYFVFCFCTSMVSGFVATPPRAAGSVIGHVTAPMLHWPMNLYLIRAAGQILYVGGSLLRCRVV